MRCMYNEILNGINRYHSLPEIVSNKDVISAYDLDKILKERFYKLESIVENEELKNVFNEYFMTEGGFFNNFLQKLIGNKKICIVEKCYNVKMYGDSEKVYMDVQTSIKREPYYLENKILFNRKGNRKINISKDRNSDFISIDKIKDDDVNAIDREANNERSKKVIIDNYDVILKKFKELEKELDFLNFSVMENKQSYGQFFDDNFIVVEFLLLPNGKYLFNYSLVNEDYNNYVDTEFVGVKNLKDILDENRDCILKRIPIQVNELEKTFKIVIDDYFSKNISISSNNNILKLDNNSCLVSYNKPIDTNISLSSLVSEVRNKYEDSNFHTLETDKAYLEFLYSIIDFYDSESYMNSNSLGKVYDKVNKFYNTFSNRNIKDDNIYMDSNNRIKVLRKGINKKIVS